MKISAVHVSYNKNIPAVSNKEAYGNKTNFGAIFQYHNKISNLFIYESMLKGIDEVALNKLWASFVRNTTNVIEKLKPEKGIVRLDFNRAALKANPDTLPQYGLFFNLPTMPPGAWAKKDLGFVPTSELEWTVIKVAKDGFNDCKEAFSKQYCINVVC